MTPGHPFLIIHDPFTNETSKFTIETKELITTEERILLLNKWAIVSYDRVILASMSYPVEYDLLV